MEDLNIYTSHSSTYLHKSPQQDRIEPAQRKIIYMDIERGIDTLMLASASGETNTNTMHKEKNSLESARCSIPAGTSPSALFLH